MEHNSQTARMLHDEHMEEVAVLERLESVLHTHKITEPPSTEDTIIHSMLADVISSVDEQVNHHFVFEEEHLFPKLTELGEGGIGEFLKSEHRMIRETGGAVLEIARDAKENGFNAENWKNFHHAGRELIEWVVGHVQKEEMGLLPLVEQIIEEDDDMELAEAYMACR